VIGLLGNKKEKTNFKELMAQKRAQRKPRLVLGIWGEPKTGKTGIALDFPDKNIYVLDWDNGADSTHKTCHDATERINVYCPIVMRKDNIIDFDKSEKNSEDFITFAKEQMEAGEDIVFVIDGVDTWFESCMLKVNPNPRVVTKIMPFQYGNRNKTFDTLMRMIFNMNCDVVYITHEAEKYIDNIAVGVRPVWRNWGGMLEQEIYCSKKKVKNELHFTAELMASRTNGNLVGKKWTVREGTPPNIQWNGVPELREGKI
jgi:hypothetical protein